MHLPLNSELLARRLEGHHGRTTAVLVGGFLSVPLLGWLLDACGGHPDLGWWTGSTLLALLLRSGVASAFHRYSKTHQSPLFWFVLTMLSVGLCGLAWGMLGLLYPAMPSGTARAIIVFALVGSSAAQAVLGHFAPGVAQTFGITSLTPLILAIAAQSDSASLALAGLIAAYMIGVTVMGPAYLGRLLRATLLNTRKLDDALERARDVERMAHMGHFDWDHQHETGNLSAGAFALFGVQPGEDIRPISLWSKVPEPERTRIMALSKNAVRTRQREVEFETCMNTNGRMRDLQVVQRFDYSSDGRLRRTLSTVAEITTLKNAQRRLHELAFSDPLTGLANRSLFAQSLGQVIERCEKDHQTAAVAMIDLDHFKKVNDSFGHNAGDHLLQQAAERLRQCVRGHDVVARLGGDEFAIIFSRAPSKDDLAKRAQQIIARLSEAFAVEDTEVFVSASLGLAFYPQDSQDIDGLMRCADVALFEAKSLGRASHYFFDESLSRRASERLALETDLRHAIERDELAVHFQPKIALNGERLIGAEALLRWQHPARGNVPPDRFIGIAEDTGLIVPIGIWVLRASCLAARDWNARLPEGAEPMKVAVNMSARQFINQNIVSVAQDILDTTGCPAHLVELEITESLLFDARSGVYESLRGLRDLGFTIAIDDFGTGYSALGYLTRFPITTLKIDRSFIHLMTENSDRLGLVNAIISMGKVLRLQLVAEGVETAAQARMLSRMGCDIAQGWLYGKAMPVDEFDAFILAWKTRKPTIPTLASASAPMPAPTPTAIPAPIPVDQPG